MKNLGAALLVAVAALAGPSCSNKVAGRSLHANPVHASDRQLSNRQLIEAYGQLPLSFEANKGQSDPRVDFQARGPGYAVFLTPVEATIVVTPRGTGSADRDRQAVVRMQLIGASPSPAKIVDPSPGTINYFRGNQRDKWTTDIPQYARVRYDAVYSGIDVVYYGKAGRLEYDFIVAPGADPGAIGVRFEGAEDLEIDGRGDLVLRVAGGEMRLPKPHIYQPGGNIVAGSYVRNGEREIGFEVGAYDRSEPLIIDPVLVYSTHLGGGTLDDFFSGSAIAVDASGSAYITGQALAFPTTPGSYQPVSRGDDEVFVAKLAPDGSRLIYATFIGGKSYDLGTGIAVDSGGRAYVTGQTFSSDFPITPGGIAAGGSPSSAFLAKLSADGSALVYSTLLAGSESVGVDDIAVDSGGHAYVTGQRLWSGAFVTKLNPAGTGVVYSTQLAAARGRAIAVDGSGSAYVTGDNASLQATPGVFQPNRGGGDDAFVIKLDPGGSIAYATHLGGSGNEFGTSIAVDPDGNAYVTGGTTSNNFPVTAGAFQDGIQGPYSQAAFVSKVNTAGSALLYSTVLALHNPVSNTSSARGSGIAVDGSRNVYITGTGRVPPVDAFQTEPFGGSSDVFVAKLNPFAFGAASLVFSTGLGGDQTDQGHDIAVDPSGNVYISGRTRSTNFMTVDPLQPWHGGGFAAKIAPTGSADLVLTMTAAPDPVTLGGELTYTLTVTNAGPDNAKRVDVIDTLYPDVVSFSASQGTCTRDPYAYNPRPIACDLGALDAGADATVTIVVSPRSYDPLVNNAMVRSNVSDPNPSDNFTVTTTVPVGAPLASLGHNCADLACAFFGSGSDNGTIVSYAWDFGDGATGSDATVNHTYAAAGTYTVSLTVTDNDGLTGTQVVTVTVPFVVVTEPPVAWFDFSCTGSECSFDGSQSWHPDPDGYVIGYDWDFGDGTTANTDWWVTHTFAPGLSYTVTLTVTDNRGLTGVLQRTIEVGRNAAPIAAFTATCIGLACTFDGSASSDVDGNITTYLWDFGDGTAGSGIVARRTYSAGGTRTVMLTVADSVGATNAQSQVVTLSNSPPVALFTAVCDGLLCSFNGAGSSDSDGTIASYVWSFGDGQSASGSSVSHAYSGGGLYTVTLTVADNSGATNARSASVTVSAPTLHVGDLDGAATRPQNTWTATVTVSVHDGAHTPVANATVSGAWTTGGVSSCTTSGSGRCTLSSPAIPKRVESVRFTVTGVTSATSIYTPGQNHDADGESEGTNITVFKR